MKRRIILLAAAVVILVGTSYLVYRSVGAGCYGQSLRLRCQHDEGTSELYDVRPNAGPVAGGTKIIITGTNFAPGSRIRFGSIPARSTQYINPGKLVAITASATAPGPAAVTVYTGDRVTTLKRSYRYEAALEITSVSPTSGPIAGGQKVTITGSGFAPDTFVDFQGADVTTMKYIDQHTLQVVTATRAAGTVDVVVTNEDESATLQSSYQYK